MTREYMDVDVVIVGAGPAGLAAAIRLAQLSKAQQTPLNICILDKGADVGSHILAGAVLEPRALDELFPNWRSLGAPLTTPVTEDHFTLLTTKSAWQLPTPPPMKNAGNYIISLADFCRWLREQAELLGVNVFPGFAATEFIFEGERVAGIITGDKGLDKNGLPKPSFQPGIGLRAKQVLLAEGCRGSLTQSVMSHFNLNQHADAQTYALGIKELWEIPSALHKPGYVQHTIGWPLDTHTYGGSFVYHWGQQLLSIGLVVGLDYKNPYLNPYEEFQRFKTHPSIAPLLKNSRRIGYGARTLIEGGIQSLPKLSFPGGLIIGDAAGFLNVPKIKGIHTAMKSGMIAAESLFPLLNKGTVNECTHYAEQLKSSWLWDELYRVRNIRPAMRHGLCSGLAYAALDTYLLRGKAPWTLHHHTPDHLQLNDANQSQLIAYPKHDNQITFDLSDSVYLANINYEENQPNHLKLKNPNLAIDINFAKYASPEQRYCPAGVYEISEPEHAPKLLIHSGNCIHCKACDIKDPTQNITWTPPEGGSGPQYGSM